MNPITIIWVIFTILFFTFGVIHIIAAYQSIQPFEVKAKGSVGKIMGVPVNTGLENFVADFNAYIAKQNNSNRFQNWLAGIGYLLASLTALISMFLTIEKYSNFLR